MEEINMTIEEKFARLNNQENAAPAAVSETKEARPIENLFDIEDRLKKKGKKAKKKRRKIKKELKNEKKKRKQVSKAYKKQKKELASIKQDISRLKHSGYDSKLNELIACNDPAERKRIAAELKRMEV